MLVINLFGEPGCGKSVTAAGLYHKLSIMGYGVEIIPEVAKGYAWETPKDENGFALPHPIFEQQIFLLGEQNRLLHRVLGKRQIAIMECPLLMTSIYRPENYFKSFDSLVLEQFNDYNNFNILLERNHAFDIHGRVHTEDESRVVRSKLIRYLDDNMIKCLSVKTHENVSSELSEIVKNKFSEHLI